MTSCTAYCLNFNFLRGMIFLIKSKFGLTKLFTLELLTLFAKHLFLTLRSVFIKSSCSTIRRHAIGIEKVLCTFGLFKSVFFKRESSEFWILAPHKLWQNCHRNRSVNKSYRRLKMSSSDAQLSAYLMRFSKK